MMLTGAGAILCASHIGRDGQAHGHTWEITAWWTGSFDALERQAALGAWLRPYDHHLLPEGLRLAEEIAAAVGNELHCERVEVRRPLERLYAEWRA